MTSIGRQKRCEKTYKCTPSKILRLLENVVREDKIDDCNIQLALLNNGNFCLGYIQIRSSLGFRRWLQNDVVYETDCWSPTVP